MGLLVCGLIQTVKTICINVFHQLNRCMFNKLGYKTKVKQKVIVLEILIR